uniref:Nudix hydrolase domain-containing protein n=1 Tax=viral metagenome TaxID=1070528 RepID=A0A6C0BE71_9ZZZZ
MTCYGFIAKKRDKIILVYKENGVLSFPKGSFERSKDKTYMDCARREFVEETTLTGFEFSYNPELYIEYTDRGTVSCSYFRCLIDDDQDFEIKQRPIDDEIVGYRWFTIEEIEAIPNDKFLERRKKIAIDFLLDLNVENLINRSFILSSSERIRISKACNKLLRHHLHEFKTATSDGFVEISELFSKLDFIVSIEKLKEVVELCEKQRLKIVDNRIRSNQGHSSGNIEEDKIFEEITTPITECYHATTKKNLNFILKDGLSIMGRTHIHFASDDILLRKNRPILIKVKM